MGWRGRGRRWGTADVMTVFMRSAVQFNIVLIVVWIEMRIKM